MSRAVYYLRVSSHGQLETDYDEDGFSIAGQRAKCDAKAALLEATPVEFYVERAESAKTDERPALEAMLERLRGQRDVDYVIVWKLDRLARNLRDYTNLVFEIESAGAKLISATENIDETPPGRLMQGILASFAEYYSRNLAHEVIKGATEKAKRGGTIGRAPLGYQNVRKIVEGKEIRTVEFDPERAPLIRWAFAAYATGQHTLDTLLDDLTEKGLTTKPTRRYPAQPIARSYLATILQNRYYVGKVRYRRVEYEGRHEPLVSQDLFDRVQEVFHAHTNSREKDRKHRHYLKGSVYCHCGERLCLTKAKGTYLYFFCVGRHQKRNGCSQRYVLAERVERAVTDYWDRLTVEPEALEQVKVWLIPMAERMWEDRERRAARARKRRSKLEAEQTTLVRSHLANPVAVPLSQLEAEQRRIGAELAAVAKEIEAAEVELALVKQAAYEALDLLADLGPAYREADKRTRRAWNQALFERIELEGDGDVVEAPYAEEAWDGFSILSEEARARGERGEPVTADPSVLGSKEKVLVGGAGFEPA